MSLGAMLSTAFTAISPAAKNLDIRRRVRAIPVCGYGHMIPRLPTIAMDLNQLRPRLWQAQESGPLTLLGLWVIDPRRLQPLLLVLTAASLRAVRPAGLAPFRPLVDDNPGLG